MSSIRSYLIEQNEDKSNKLRYYVYAYIRSKDSPTAKAGTPYYIGKGCGNRAWDKHGNIPKPTDNLIVIIEHNLTNFGSIVIEKKLISWWGRTINNSGVLRNILDADPVCASYDVLQVEKITKTCAECGSEYESREKQYRKYCCKECELESRTHKKKSIEKRICLHCDKEFECTTFVKKGKQPRQFCSHSCAFEYKSRKDIRKCACCTIEFTVTENSKATCCSIKCGNLMKPTIPLETRTCALPLCEETFDVLPKATKTCCCPSHARKLFHFLNRESSTE